MQNRDSKRFPTILFLAALFFAVESPAMAYSDPGSGALLWQLLAAAFLGLLYRLRRFKDRFIRWRR